MPSQEVIDIPAQYLQTLPWHDGAVTFGWKPTSLVQRIVAAGVLTVTFCVYVTSDDIVYHAVLALLWLAVLCAMSIKALPLLRPASTLAFKNSRWMQLCNVKTHIICAVPTTVPRASAVMVMAHGFGASSMQFSYSMDIFARTHGIKAVGFDMQGFGLTTRSTDTSSYLLRKAADMQMKITRECTQDLDTDIVLLGHSMGGIVASYAAIDVGSRCLLVLVAPAILAPAEKSTLSATRRFLLGLLDAQPVHAPGWVARLIVSVSIAFIRIALALILPVLVYSPLFWRRGVGAFYSKYSTPRSELLNMYRWPSLCEQWKEGMIEFVVSLLASRAGLLHQGAPEPLFRERSLLNELQDAVAVGRVSVLIVQGEEDPLVPVSCAHELGQELPGARVVVMKGVGHMPHEEDPAAFCAIVAKFIEEHGRNPLQSNVAFERRSMLCRSASGSTVDCGSRRRPNVSAAKSQQKCRVSPWTETSFLITTFLIKARQCFRGATASNPWVSRMATGRSS